MRLRAYTGTVLLALAACGCAQSELPNGETLRAGRQEVEITFDLGSDVILNSGESPDAGPTSGCTFVPDGVILPRNLPPRMLLSSNNWQQVNDVRIYVFRRNDAGEFTYYRPVSESGEARDYLPVDDFTLKFASSPWTVWWGGPDDCNEAHRYVGRLRLDAGEYRFLALARDDREAADSLLADPNRSDADRGWQAWTEGSTTLDQAAVACENGAVTASTELFAGCTGEAIAVDGSEDVFFRSIELKRAVAGVLLYVENIPATVPAYDPDEELSTGIIPMLVDFPVVSLAVVHGSLLSDRVLAAGREAVAGTLDVARNDFIFNPPTPVRVLLKIDIPEQATVRNGFYENTAPDNVRHPNSLLGGAFVMPQLANTPSGDVSEAYDKSLYLVFLARSSRTGREFALKWIPVRLAAGSEYDPLYYPLLANHFYAIGRRCFAADGSDLPAEEDVPIDLRKGTTADIVIRLDPFWNEYYGGEIGDAQPGLGLDPEWGDHPAGNLQQ